MKKFTLIELLVVISIIGILSTLLLPSLSSARFKTMGAICKNNLKQLYIMKSSYSDSNDEYFMYWPVGNNNGLWYKHFTDTGGDGAYSLSDGELKILECPVIYSITPGNLTRGAHRNIGMNSFLPGRKWTGINDPVSMILLGDGYNHHTNDGTPTAGFYSWSINGNVRLGENLTTYTVVKRTSFLSMVMLKPKQDPFVPGEPGIGIQICSEHFLRSQ
ncbi:MAG: type II secretion system GspH family protein [Lentisphaerales bacterium]|nr:type II secretion system GspH family protein [Lentisphaerales bacterium]